MILGLEIYTYLIGYNINTETRFYQGGEVLIVNGLCYLWAFVEVILLFNNDYIWGCFIFLVEPDGRKFESRFDIFFNFRLLIAFILFSIMKLFKKLFSTRNPVKWTAYHAKSSQIFQIKAICNIISCIITSKNRMTNLILPNFFIYCLYLWLAPLIFTPTAHHLHHLLCYIDRFYFINLIEAKLNRSIPFFELFDYIGVYLFWLLYLNILTKCTTHFLRFTKIYQE